MKTFAQWLQRKWQSQPKESDLIDTVALVFGTEHGRYLLNHWIDSVYATVCETNDAMELVAHNARRAFVHEILQKLDQHTHPNKYKIKIEEGIADARLNASLEMPQ